MARYSAPDFSIEGDAPMPPSSDLPPDEDVGDSLSTAATVDSAPVVLAPSSETMRIVPRESVPRESVSSAPTLRRNTRPSDYDERPPSPPPPSSPPLPLEDRLGVVEYDSQADYRIVSAFRDLGAGIAIGRGAIIEIWRQSIKPFGVFLFVFGYTSMMIILGIYLSHFIH
jgi:hypothetical protein